MLKLHSNRDGVLQLKNSLEEFLLKICKTEGLKTKEVDSLEGMLDQENLSHNLKVIERYYQKRLNSDEFDECYYIKDRDASTPSKFTPFARQGAANKLFGNIRGTPGGADSQSDFKMMLNNKRLFQSQRVLEYEVSENVSMNTNLRDIRPMSKATSQSPAPKVIPATPMTAALQMYNWLNEKVKKMKKVMLLSISKANNIF